jgi:hypothetical protein
LTVEVVKRRSDPLDLAATLTDLSSWLQAGAEPFTGTVSPRF